MGACMVAPKKGKKVSKPSKATAPTKSGLKRDIVSAEQI